MRADFQLKPSRQYMILIILAIGISMVAVFNLPIRLWIKLGGCFLLMIYGCYLLRGQNSMTSLRRKDDGRWLITTTKACFTAKLRGDSTVTTLVSVLRFQLENHWPAKSYLIFRDSLPPDAYRQLLVLLHLKQKVT